MENTQALENQHGHPAEATKGKDPVVKSLMKVFWILLIITIGEVALAFLHYFTGIPPRGLLNAVFIGLTILKAFYIVGEFMHLRHELKSLVWTILLPLVFIFWGIVAFLWDGNSWKNMRHNERHVIEASAPWEKVTQEKH